MSNQQNEHESMESQNLSTNTKTDILKFASTDTMATAVLVLMHKLIQPPLFPLGQIVATPGALDLLDRTGTNASELLARHQRGDWGVVCTSDASENNHAVMNGERVLSAYELGKQRERIWIITERDRSVTTLLLPEEY
jgi:hypothetical protein